MMQADLTKIELHPDLKRLLDAAMPADMAPHVLRFMAKWCNDYYEGAFKAYLADERSKREGIGDRMDRDFGEGDKSKTPVWMWWNMLGHRFEDWAREIEREIAERGMTQGEKRRKWREAEIARKQAELAELQKPK